MVQIIREQTRQYAADQSGAIETAQVAQNISDWNNVIRGAGRIAGSIMDANAKAEKEAEKKAIEADQQMIDTQIGSKAQTELLKWNVQQIEAGVDPNSDEYTQKLYAKRDELYQPYLDKMTSEKGRNILQKQGLDTAERIRQSNIGQIAKNRQKAQARQAFADTAKNMQNDAREFGKLGDWEGFKEATKDDRKAMVDYAKANGNPKTAEFAVDANNITNYLAGLSESEPEAVVAMLDDKDTLKEIVYDRIDKEKPGLSDKKKEEIFEDMYKDANQEQVGKEALLEVLPESVLKQYTDSFVAAKKEEVQDIKDRMKETPKGSKAYEHLESRLDEAEKQIEAPKDSAIAELRSDLSKTVLPIAKKQIGMNKLQAKQLEKEAEISTYRAVLNPDTSVSNEAMIALALGRKQTEETLQMSLPDDDMQKAYDAYAQANTEVLQREYATFDGTEAMFDAYNKVLRHDPADQLGAIKEVFDGYVALHNAPVTQEQADNYKALMHAAITDNAFADLVKGYVSIKDRYYPDTSWFENSIGRADNPALRTVGASPLILDPSNIDFYSRSREEQETLENYDQSVYNMPEGVRLDEQGLVTTAIMAQDKDTIEKYLKNKTIEIMNNTGGMLALAAAEKDPDTRNALGQKALDYFDTEKRKAFDYAMENFGVDMAKLREVYNTRGEAITQLGMKRVKYIGDDPSTGLPNWEPYEDEKATNEERDRILLASKMI